MATRYWSPSRTYEFEVKVGARDLTPDLYKLTILTGIDFPYQTFQLEFFLSADDIILEKIYGQEEIKLTANFFATAPNIPETITEFSLMYLSGDVQLSTQDTMNTQRDVTRVPIAITAVSRDSFKIMSNYVNEVYINTTVSSVVQDIINKSKGIAKIDKVGKNTDVLDQVVVPPTTLYQAIKHLNRTFGVFNGWLGLWCSYDKTVYLKNLTSKMNSSHLFSVYQLSSNSDNSKIIQERDDKSFYTINPIDTKYSGNTKFAVFAPTMKHIVKPKDSLSYIIDLNLESFARDYGLISQKNKIFFDNFAIASANRKRIYKDHTGYEKSEAFINANISEEIGDLSELKITIEQFLRIESLMKVGEAVMFVSKVDDFKDLTGKYILRATQLNFTKGKDWEASADLRLIRTNRIISKD